MQREELIQELMTLQHLCRRWGAKQDPGELYQRKLDVVRILRPFRAHKHSDVRIWVEVIMLAIHDLYQDAPLHTCDDTGGRTRAASDPLYFFDGRLKNHCDLMGVIAAPDVLNLMKRAKLFPQSVWDRISF